MSPAASVIVKIEITDYKKMIIETSDKKKYFSDLSSFSGVYCFPKKLTDGKDVSIDSYGLGLIWAPADLRFILIRSSVLRRR